MSGSPVGSFSGSSPRFDASIASPSNIQVEEESSSPPTLTHAAASSPLAIARKFSMSRFKANREEGVHSPTNVTTRMRDELPALKLSKPTDTINAVASSPTSVLKTLFRSFFSSPLHPHSTPDGPPSEPAPEAAVDKSSSMLKQPRHAYDLRSWVLELPTSALWGFTGEALLGSVKKHLEKRDVASFVAKRGLTRAEAAAILLFTSRTSIGALVRDAISEHFEDKANVFSPNSVLMPSLCDPTERHEHAAILAPLLSGVTKLECPTGGETTFFCALENSVIDAHNDFQSELTLPTMLSVSSCFPESLCHALGGSSKCRLLAIKSRHARLLGPLNLSVDPSLELGDEALLLPGWKGRFVGTVHQRWKKLMSAVFCWDVTTYTIMEIVEDVNAVCGATLVADANGTESPNRKWRRAVESARFSPEPFVAKEYLVRQAERRVHRRVDADDTTRRDGNQQDSPPSLVSPRTREAEVMWHMYLGLLHSYATGHYVTAKSHFESVLKVRSSDHSAQLQLGLLHDRHLNAPRVAKTYYEQALRSSADNADVYHLLGSLLRRSFKEYGSAKKYLEAALRLDPRHVAAHAEYGWILDHYCDDAEGAEEHYQSALRMEPNHAEANYCYAYSREVRHKDYRGARRHYTLCVAADPLHVMGHFRLGKLLDEHYQQYSEAKLQYSDAVRIQPNHADAHHLLGFLLLMHFQEVPEAKRHLEAAVAADPQHADAHNHLGYLLWRHEKDWISAKQCFARAIELCPSHVNAHSNLGRGILEEECADNRDQQQQHGAVAPVQEALDHFAVAVRGDPNDVFVRTTYAAALIDHRSDQRADLQTALLHLEVCVSKNPCYAPAHFHFARAMACLNKNPKRIKAELDIAIELDETCADAHNELGLLYESKLGDFKKARHHYEQAIQLRGGEHITALNNLGLLLWHHFEDVTEARRCFELALAKSPTHLDVLRNVSALYVSVFQDYRRARRCLQIIVGVVPTDVPSLVLLGSVLRNGYKDHRRARYYLEQARRCSPGDVSIVNELALLHLRGLHDSVAALELFEEALQMDPGNGCAARNIDRILTYSKRYQAAKANRNANRPSPVTPRSTSSSPCSSTLTSPADSTLSITS